MASVCKDKSGRRSIQFTHPSRGRQTLRLGKATKHVAHNVKTNVERLIASLAAGQSLDLETTTWVNSLAPKFHERLVRVGLVSPRKGEATKRWRLREFLDKRLTALSHLRPNTQRNVATSARRLEQYFGPDKLIDEITKGDAEEWRNWLLTRGYRVNDKKGNKESRGLSVATVARDAKRAQEFFQAAVKHRYIESNPFAELKVGSQANESRLFFVPRDWIERILDACPSTEWRLIVALCRFGGLRCPTEVNRLRWQDIDWARERITITSPKTARYPNGGKRVIPLFPELASLLRDAFEQAEAGAEYVITSYRSDQDNLRTQFLRILKRTDITPWPRLFQNLRSTRETELSHEFPIQCVCAWIGNTARVARNHYLQVREADFQKATQKTTHTRPVWGRTEPHRQAGAAENAADSSEVAELIPPTGFEPVT
jgi:integrase